MTDEEWNLLYQTIAHGADDHKKWLHGMISGYANGIEKRKVNIPFEEISFTIKISGGNAN